MTPLSERMSRIDTSKIRRAFDLAAKLTRPINLSIGQPHYATPEPILDAITKAMREGKTAYTPTQGILPLRERLAQKYKEVNGFTAKPEDILVTSGISSLIQLILLATIDPGTRVLITEPCFLIYRSLLKYFNASVSTIPETFTQSDLDAVPPGDFRLIVFCTPSNPTGYVMKREQIQNLAKFAEARNSLLVADEIYELFDYEKQFVSAASIYPNTLTLSGFSKTYSMTGLRLASAHGPTDVIKAMTTLQQYTIVCAPAPVQWAGIAALDLDMSSYVQMYKKNRDMCVKAFTGKLTFPEPGGAFYIFPQIGENEDTFVERAIAEKQLLVVPGSIFCSRTDSIRISYATTEENLKEGLQAFLELLGKL
ncbi:MAG: aminotransferase class I/II-fold pyridoxal phosphate-dependent enzyme [Leptospirales bacterium]|nr:aminotransferase class I/II-fold pyridoxal phosphate-dependent enzyme [Leptospirales bacterium]